ncbi:aldo/keto reductase [Amycolatopsis benzoatilytica]|uniref:aldo/keto reductase n=1 Tax=Amycolatopsis benzoatilytica TaxID=346045 RepID=UPI00037A2E85|nr:aldo/keto reductase [Amycolatopsis benzoatilytica]
MAVPPLVTLNNSVAVPQLGLGMYQVAPDQVGQVVSAAFDAGYRSLDTAAMYGNEAAVGEAVRESGLPRSEVFVTTKLWNTEHGYDNALRAFDRSAEALGIGVVDLYLIHWPMPELDRYVETWRALERLLREGRVRAIGVSNFGIDHLRRLLASADVVPAVNQVELHPWQQQLPLRTFHAEHGIATEAWSPLARGRRLADRVVVSLAAKYGKTPAQLVLRWHLQSGIIAIPKSATPSRIRENAEVFDFELAEDDLLALAELDS